MEDVRCVRGELAHEDLFRENRRHVGWTSLGGGLFGPSVYLSNEISYYTWALCLIPFYIIFRPRRQIQRWEPYPADSDVGVVGVAYHDR